MKSFKSLFKSLGTDTHRIATLPPQSIPLSISSNYVSDWGIWEALRELAQNTLDHADKTGTKPSIRYRERSKDMLFISEGAKLEVSSLILGNGSKVGSYEQRGQFGEGYKLALVVLLRLGIEVTIYNGDEIWKPQFIHNEQFGIELLTIVISKSSTRNTDLTIQLSNIEPEQAATAKHRVLLDRTKAIGYQTPHGTILTEERFKGQVFVGGIYVCTPNLSLDHGYDFNPDEVSLGRDRGLMDSFNVQWLASKMWNESAKMNNQGLEETAKLVKYGYAGTTYLGHASTNEVLSEKVSKDFYDEFSENAVPVTTEKERKTVLDSYDNAIPVIVNDTLKTVVKDSKQYEKTKHEVLKERVKLTPHTVVTMVLQKHKDEMGEFLYSKLSQELVPKSLQWKLNENFEDKE